MCIKPCLVIDELRNVMFPNGEYDLLSKHEYLLIKYLYNKKGEIVSRSELIQHCWPEKIVSPTSLPVAIKHLRDLLRKAEKNEVIKTHKGEGYSFIPDIVTIEFSTSSVSSFRSIKKKKDGVNGVLVRFLLRCNPLTVSVMLMFFAITTIFSDNIKHRNNNGSVVVFPDNFMPSLEDAGIRPVSGETIFIDKMDSMLVCNNINCEFTR
ncbi:winged helix-turn-helix domain-containing protein [Escherichia coli]|nr:winged helix-turn-helix domain-containing protein [Escherichia coli]